ncbi:hypothetical protein JX266_012141 [Neoarthrinium moseri]|nr:hypothetical protein JX266_012141 [Neoarthrinium moseri]
MRLINTESYELEEFLGDQIPRYAILSHTWEQNQEVSLHEWKTYRRDLAPAFRKRGYDKITAACFLASSQGLSYLWVDTNCIDKTSSAELTEAINSMFNWYRNSTICFAYLFDVVGVAKTDPDPLFERSRWFTRGWTLQELLAPHQLEFYTRDWEPMGSKKSRHLAISRATGIDTRYLTGLGPGEACVAEKMNWVAKRSTTRPEDLAYCMLGLFDINMPLLYGEGSRAFIRLQEEILRKTNDHTIFCWRHYWSSSHSFDGILASTPKAFQLGGRSIVETNKKDWRKSAYSLTNAGLNIRLPLIRTLTGFYGVLDVSWASHTYGRGLRGQRLCIPLEGSIASGVFKRVLSPPVPLCLSAAWAQDDIDAWIPPIQRFTRTPMSDATQLPKYGVILMFRDLHPLKTLDLGWRVTSAFLPLAQRARWTSRPSAVDYNNSTLALEPLCVPDLVGAVLRLYLGPIDSLKEGQCTHGVRRCIEVFFGFRTVPMVGQPLHLRWLYHIFPPVDMAQSTDPVDNRWEDFRILLENGGPFDHYYHQMPVSLEIGEPAEVMVDRPWPGARYEEVGEHMLLPVLLRPCSATDKAIGSSHGTNSASTDDDESMESD